MPSQAFCAVAVDLVTISLCSSSWHWSTQVVPDKRPLKGCVRVRSAMSNSHRHTRQDKTVLSVSYLVCRCELDDCCEREQISNFLSATVLSCQESNSHRRSGRGTDEIVLSCLAWRCERECVSALEMASPRNRHCVNCIGTLSFAITQYIESQYEPLGVVGAEGEQLTAAGLSQLDGPDSAAEHRPTLPPAAPPTPTHSVLVHRPARAFSRQCTSHW